ncbi:MAG: hypothetical protein HY731_14155 [Candidatus Tectomicrobia bacterium]|nr:hypothetical protein [Candidatus Tectomicrobia bacterium]
MNRYLFDHLLYAGLFWGYYIYRYSKNTNFIFWSLFPLYVGLRFPDIDETWLWDILINNIVWFISGLPFGHRNPLTHSILPYFILVPLFRKGVARVEKVFPSINSNHTEIMTAIKGGFLIGLGSHLFVDVAHIIPFFSTFGFWGHEGHGGVTLIPEAYEDPYLIIMGVLCFIILRRVDRSC